MLEKTTSSTNAVGKTGYPHIRLKLDPYLSPYTKINSKESKTLMLDLKL
jgi:hypothetical protein